jgi:hypothetical protein
MEALRYHHGSFEARKMNFLKVRCMAAAFFLTRSSLLLTLTGPLFHEKI